MSNWYIDYHHAHLLRLVSLVIVFGILWPSLCLLVVAGSRLAARVSRRITFDARMRRGRSS